MAFNNRSYIHTAKEENHLTLASFHHGLKQLSQRLSWFYLTSKKVMFFDIVNYSQGGLFDGPYLDRSTSMCIMSYLN